MTTFKICSTSNLSLIFEDSSSNLTNIDNNYYKSLLSIGVLFIFGVCCVLLNVWVFSTIPNKKSYPSMYAQINAILSSSLMAVGNTLGYLQDCGIISFHNYSWGCQIWAGFSCISLSLSSFTVLQLFAEATMPSNNFSFLPNNGRKNNIFIKCCTKLGYLKIFITIWIVVLLATVPAIASFVQMEHNGNFSTAPFPSQCRRVPLLGISFLNKIYLMSYSVIFVFFPSIFMICALRSMNFKIKYLYLCKTIPRGMKNHIRRIRLAFFHTLLYILLWIPIGIMVPLKKGRTETSGTFTFSQTTQMLIARFILLLHICLQPFFFMYAHFGLKLPEFLLTLGDTLRRRCLPCIADTFEVDHDVGHGIRNEFSESWINLETIGLSIHRVQNV